VSSTPATGNRHELAGKRSSGASHEENPWHANEAPKP
jgi:hypothetical protein